MIREFKLIDNLYKEDKQGNPKLFKANVVTYKLMDTNDIYSVEQIINNKGKVLIKRCKLITKDGPLVVEHPYTEMVKLKLPITINGFRR